MNRIETIDFFTKNIEGKTTNHLVFSTIHSLKGFLEPKFFIGKRHVQLDITHDNGDVLRFTLNTQYDIYKVEAVYGHIDHGAKLINDYKLKIDHPKNFRDWMLAQFEHNQLADICNHGVNGGFSGLIYTKEINQLYDRYHESLWDILDEMRDSMGADNDLALMAQFGGASRVNSDSTFKELVVWACAEEIAHSETQGEYKEDEDETDNSEE